MNFCRWLRVSDMFKLSAAGMAGGARIAALLRATLLPPSPRRHAAAASYTASRGMASSKLFVGGLSYLTDDTSLRDTFAPHGEIVEAKVILDHETGKSRGFGFVTYFSEGEAETAVQKLDGRPLNGRLMRVSYAINKSREPMGGGGFQPGYRQPYGQADSGFGAGSPSMASSYGSGFPREDRGWDDSVGNPVTRSTLSQRNLYEHDGGGAWDDDDGNMKGFSSASKPRSNTRRDYGNWDDALENRSTNTSSTSGKEDDWDFQYGDFESSTGSKDGNQMI